jgi:hypothetical protein
MLKNEIAKNRIVLAMQGLPVELEAFTTNTSFGFNMYVVTDPASYHTLSEKIIALGLDPLLLRKQPSNAATAYETVIDVPVNWQPPEGG